MSHCHDGGGCGCWALKPTVLGPDWRNYQDAFARLDEVTRRHVMKSAPFVMREPFRRAFRLAGRGLGRLESHILRQGCGWKLFFLVLRMFLSRPPRGGFPGNKLECLETFAAGH